MPEISSDMPLERHPFAPWVPEGAKALIMGTFPPGPHRWAMEFYYPNPTNDFWRIMGIIFKNDKDAYYNPTCRKYNLPAIKAMLTEKGIALSDTGAAVRRLMGNASDKFLEIVEPVDLFALLEAMPDCRAIATTGEKAAEVIASLTSTVAPKMGHHTEWVDNSGRTYEIWRLPSTSRAYPLSPVKKAEYYESFFKSAGIL